MCKRRRRRRRQQSKVARDRRRRLKYAKRRLLREDQKRRQWASGKRGPDAMACSRKKRYGTMSEAERYAAKYELRRGVRLRIYRCPVCGGYHLTHKRAKRGGRIKKSYFGKGGQ